MKYLILLLLVVSGASQAKDIQNCGNTKIEQVITGPRHGSLLNLENNNCGLSGYVCIDLEGEYSSEIKGKAAFSFALAAHMAQKEIHISIDLDSRPASCGSGYPVVEDIRSK